MSASCSPAARLATTLPTLHANAATITSRKPTSVPAGSARELVAAEQHDARRRDRRAHEVVPLEMVTEKADTQADREEYLALDHQ